MKTDAQSITIRWRPGVLATLLLLTGTGSLFAQFPGGFGGGGGGGRGGNNQPANPSGGLQAATQVAVVADEYSNSLIILAPDLYHEAISNLVTQLDVPVQDITELRVFALQNADPTEMAQVLNSLFPDDTTAATTTGGRGPGFQFGGRNNQAAATTGSERAKKQSKVLAVADPRTSSVLVSASKDLLDQITPMIAQLDASSSKKQKVFVYSLENADSTEVEAVLRNLFEGQNTRTGAQNNQQNNALQQRQNNAARTQGTGTGTAAGFGGGGGLGTGTGR